MALMVAGTLFPPSYWDSFRAARIAAMIPSTRLRASSMNEQPGAELHAADALSYQRDSTMFAFCSPNHITQKGGLVGRMLSWKPPAAWSQRVHREDQWSNGTLAHSWTTLTPINTDLRRPFTLESQQLTS
jgi:hypothetical protein